MDLSAEAQVRKQRELRDLKRQDQQQFEGAYGRRASKPLELKWKVSVARSPWCEGCGSRTGAGAGGSKAWKCGPCTRALEEGYIRALEHQEQNHQQKLEQTLALGVSNVRYKEQHEQQAMQIQELQLQLHENSSHNEISKSYIQQLYAQLAEEKNKFQETIKLQNEVMSENGRLHAAAQNASMELERTAHVARDLEYANSQMRSENQQLQDRIQNLLETIGNLREELRMSFKSSEDTSRAMTAERREWQQAIQTLQGENDDLRRRLNWLETMEDRKRQDTMMKRTKQSTGSRASTGAHHPV